MDDEIGIPYDREKYVIGKHLPTDYEQEYRTAPGIGDIVHLYQEGLGCTPAIVQHGIYGKNHLDMIALWRENIVRVTDVPYSKELKNGTWHVIGHDRKVF